MTAIKINPLSDEIRPQDRLEPKELASLEAQSMV